MVPQYDTKDVEGLGKFDVLVSTIRYTTRIYGLPAELSGLYCRAIGTDSVRQILYLRDLNVSADMQSLGRGVPSLYRPNKPGFDDIKNIIIPLSSAGYSIIIPDGLGFGISKSSPHQYNDQKRLVGDSRDALYASYGYQLSRGNDSYARSIHIVGYKYGALQALWLDRLFSDANNPNGPRVKGVILNDGHYNLDSYIMNTMEVNRADYQWSRQALLTLYHTNLHGTKVRPFDQLFSKAVNDDRDILKWGDHSFSTHLNPLFRGQFLSRNDFITRNNLKVSSLSPYYSRAKNIIFHHSADNLEYPLEDQEKLIQSLRGGQALLKTYSNPPLSQAESAKRFVKTTIADLRAIDQ